MDEDLKTGALKEYNRNEKFAIDSTLTFKSKKNKKEKKKQAGNEFLSLDIGLISKIKDLQLTPPAYAELVRPFINELEEKLRFFNDEAQKKLVQQPAKEDSEKVYFLI